MTGPHPPSSRVPMLGILTVSITGLLALGIAIGVLGTLLLVPTVLDTDSARADAAREAYLRGDTRAMAVLLEAHLAKDPAMRIEKFSARPGETVLVHDSPFQAADGNTLAVWPGADGGYCIKATSTTAPDRPVLYDSGAGGYNPADPVSCR